jgi:hypothetical protein
MADSKCLLVLQILSWLALDSLVSDSASLTRGAVHLNFLGIGVGVADYRIMWMREERYCHYQWLARRKYAAKSRVIMWQPIALESLSPSTTWRTRAEDSKESSLTLVYTGKRWGKEVYEDKTVWFVSRQYYLVMDVIAACDKQYGKRSRKSKPTRSKLILRTVWDR